MHHTTWFQSRMLRMRLLSLCIFFPHAIMDASSLMAPKFQLQPSDSDFPSLVDSLHARKLKYDAVGLGRGGDNSIRHERLSPKTSDQYSNTSDVVHVAKILNASSKWILAAANLLGVYVFREEGAFLVIGCIFACFGTEHVLKPLWNQARPLNSPLVDPGMPSSHSLASFFVAVAWSHVLLKDGGQGTTRLLLYSIATLVASLRTICGYHTLAQISVGALLGICLGHGWMSLVWKRCQLEQLIHSHPITKWLIWSFYGAGSAIFIVRIMSKWISHELFH